MIIAAFPTLVESPGSTPPLNTTPLVAHSIIHIRATMADEVKPYRIAVSDSAIELLNTKLGLATFPDEVDFSDDPNYGATSTDVKRLVGYWKDGFNWRTQEQRLNKMPQYTTTIAVDGFDDLQIHFVHQRSSNPGSIPLLFCHGCEQSSSILHLIPSLGPDALMIESE